MLRKQMKLMQKANAIPDIISVHCIATLENCPDCTLNEDYGTSIRRFLASEKHIAKNIISTKLQYVSCRLFRNNVYTYTVSIIMIMKMARLWESPANCVGKHLGLTNCWKYCTFYFISEPIKCQKIKHYYQYFFLRALTHFYLLLPALTNSYHSYPLFYPLFYPLVPALTHSSPLLPALSHSYLLSRNFKKLN